MWESYIYLCTIAYLESDEVHSFNVDWMLHSYKRIVETKEEIKDEEWIKNLMKILDVWWIKKLIDFERMDVLYYTREK